MICPNCKKVYNNRVSYCISCGTELVPEEKSETDKPDTENPAEKSTAAEPGGVFGGEVFAEKDSEHGFVRKINMTSGASTEKISLEPVSVKKTGGSREGLCRRIISGTASAALSVLLAAAFVLMFGTLAGRELTDEKNISNGVRSVDLLSVPISEIGLLSTEDYEIPSDATLEEAVAVMTAGSGVTGGNIRSIYENSTISSFLSSVAADYARYLRNGTQPDKITADKVKEILSENVSIISRNTGFNLTDADIALAYSEIEKSSKLLEALSVSSLESRAGDYIRLARAYISVPALAAEASAAVIIIAMIYLINRKAKTVLRYGGIPIAASGLAALIFTFMFSMQIGFFSGFSGLEREIAKGASAAAADGMYRTGAAFFFIGAAALLISLLPEIRGKNGIPKG